jgi:NAD(P)H-hydrate epimerase
MTLTALQMKAAEEALFRQGQSPEGLMEVAGEGVARCIRQFFPTPGTVAVYFGKGHNGGDALVAARHLRSSGWRVLLRHASSQDDLAPLTRLYLDLLKDADVVESVPQVRGTLLILDGLLGIGATGAARGAIAELITEMNRIRSERGAFTVAVDLPSGLDASSGSVTSPCVQADLTVTLGAVKTGLLTDASTIVVGRLALVQFPGITLAGGDPARASTSIDLRRLIPLRNFDSFKGAYGRIGILAGSPGYLGAARLCSAAAVHSGAGLVTLYATPDCYEILAAACIPEVMVRKVDSYTGVLQERNDVLAIGPGLGREHDGELRGLVAEAPVPCIVDADALNAVSMDPTILAGCAAPRLLTPHPGEMERLFPRSGRSRRDWGNDFVSRYPVTLLLKGARTVIVQREQPPVFNVTGNPGMGSGGMGDVLTGLCAALLGGGQTPHDAAMLGAWLCGRAAEIAIFNDNDSQESLSATSVMDHLGVAFSSLRDGEF